MIQTINRQFETFRVSFYSHNVTVYDDSMVYRTPKGLADKMCEDANDLIRKLNLDLVAIPTTFANKDSFHVKNIETSDI